MENGVHYCAQYASWPPRQHQAAWTWLFASRISSLLEVQVAYNFVGMFVSIWRSSPSSFVNLEALEVGQTSSVICCLDTAWLHSLTWYCVHCLGYIFLIWTPIYLEFCRDIPWYVRVIATMFYHFWRLRSGTNGPYKCWPANPLDCSFWLGLAHLG